MDVLPLIQTNARVPIILELLSQVVHHWANSLSYLQVTTVENFQLSLSNQNCKETFETRII